MQAVRATAAAPGGMLTARAASTATAAAARGTACSTSASSSSSSSSLSCRVAGGTLGGSPVFAVGTMNQKNQQQQQQQQGFIRVSPANGHSSGAKSRSRQRRRGRASGRCDASASGVPGAIVGVETFASLVGDSIPMVLQQPAGLTFAQTMLYSACFAFGLMVLVGSLRPALVVLHNAWDGLWRKKAAERKQFPDSFYGFMYKILRTALLMVGLAWTYVVIVPISSEGAHQLFPPERCVRLLRIVFYGYFLNSFRKRYLARFAGQLRQRIYGKMEPADLIPAHVYDRETGVLVWGLTLLAGLDSLGLPLQWVVKGLGASTVVLGILASVVLRDTVANYFGGVIVMWAGWFSPKEVVRVLLSGRREISGRVEHIGLLYTKLINRAGKVAYIPNSAMVAYKVENLSRAPYREFREQLAIPFKDLGHVPEIQARIEAFLRGTAGADLARGVSLAPRCTLTGINSFAGGAVLEVVCYNEYRTLRQQGYTTMRLRHHIFLGIAEIFESLGVDFAIAGTNPGSGSASHTLGDNGLEGWGDSSAAGKGGVATSTPPDAFYDALDDRAAVGMYARTPWL